MTNMIQDIQNMNSGLLGKLYYVRCKDDERYFKSIRFNYNGVSNSITKQVSNPVYGEPPDTIEEMPEHMMKRFSIRFGCM